MISAVLYNTVLYCLFAVSQRHEITNTEYINKTREHRGRHAKLQTRKTLN